MSPQVVAVALVVALTYFAGVEVVRGAKWAGHQAKRGGAAVVHLLKKIPHPRSTDDDA
jgi:hypothetical protein